MHDILSCMNWNGSLHVFKPPMLHLVYMLRAVLPYSSNKFVNITYLPSTKRLQSPFPNYRKEIENQNVTLYNAKVQ